MGRLTNCEPVTYAETCPGPFDSLVRPQSSSNAKNRCDGLLQSDRRFRIDASVVINDASIFSRSDVTIQATPAYGHDHVAFCPAGTFLASGRRRNAVEWNFHMPRLDDSRCRQANRHNVQELPSTMMLRR